MCHGILCAAAKPAGLKPADQGSFMIFTFPIPHMQNASGRDSETLGCSLENTSIRLMRADFGGHMNDLKPMRQLERFQQRAQAIVPIGNHRQANALLPQRRKRGNDVLVYMPTCLLYTSPSPRD